jgi:hypothetical protein
MSGEPPMAFNMMLWQDQQGKLVELPKQRLDTEERLEDWLFENIALLGLDLLIIGRQVVTPSRGRIDLLALDAEGAVVIIELKRDLTPREVVAQILDYASWVDSLTPADVESIAQRSVGKNLSDAFRLRFDTELPETVNDEHRMIIVASMLDDSSERIVQYLSSRHSLDINVVFFNCFLQNGSHLIGRSWLMDPQDVEKRSEIRRRSPWTGYWFVNVGDGESRSWEDARKYGFVAAGHGVRYSGPLKKLAPRDQIFGYMKGHGYVGFGEVAAKAVMAKDFTPAGSAQRLFDLPLSHEGIRLNSDDPELADWAVGVDWKKAFDASHACRFDGMFANQNIVCKLRDQPTIDRLKTTFGITG